MENFIRYMLVFHVLVGTVALISGAAALAAPKGKAGHTLSGSVYFYAMTLVFITGIIVAGFGFNRFLFFIAFLSYYSVFSGVRFLKLKMLHKNQYPKWYDWAAGIVSVVSNLVFIGMGLFYLFQENNNLAGALLAIGFGLGGLLIVYANLKPFIVRPKLVYHWYLAHIGNMMGGYIATFTAFLSTMVTRFEIMNPYLAFALPSLLGIPLLLFWQHKIKVSFAKRHLE